MHDYAMEWYHKIYDSSSEVQFTCRQHIHRVAEEDHEDCAIRRGGREDFMPLRFGEDGARG